MKKFQLTNNRISLRQAMVLASNFLKEYCVDEPKVDAMIMMESATGYSRSEYFMRRDEEMTKTQKNKFSEFISKRAKRIPLQHIIGEAWFYGRRFIVNQDVLIPRPDTEVLVEETLKHVFSGMSILDLCTGSGCVAVTLAKEADVNVTASDINVAALEIAKKNARINSAECKFILSDMFEHISSSYDIIVSNPPYIKSADIESLQPEVRYHDPLIALDGGADGLSFYRIIAENAKEYLRPKGMIFVEIGADQSNEVIGIFRKFGYENIKAVNDLNSIPRVIIAGYNSN